MFSVLLRAAITFLVAPILIFVWAMGMNPLIDAIADFGVADSRHVEWLGATVDWLALVVLLSLVIWVVAAALEHRGVAR